MRISLSVLILDDLTGRPVTGSNARAWIENTKPPIKKDGGIYIFTDLPEGEYTVNAEGGTFSRSMVKCAVSEGKMESLTVRLRPNSLYPTPPDCVRIEGKCLPGEELAFYSAEKSTGCKLLTDVKKGAGSLGIYHPDSLNIEGRLMRIISSGKNGEFIRIKSVKDRGTAEYFLYEELRGSYPKVGTILAEAYEVEGDEKGAFTVLLKSGTYGRGIICESMRDGRKAELENSGGYIHADMTADKTEST